MHKRCFKSSGIGEAENFDLFIQKIKEDSAKVAKLACHSSVV